MDIKKAAPITDAANEHANNSTPCFKFCSGNSGIVQRRVISYLLALHDGGLDSLSPEARLEMVGTDAIRKLSMPHLNPLEYISQLRRLNGDGCLSTVRVMLGKNRGSAPAYYHIPENIRGAWRTALQARSQGGDVRADK